MEISAIGRGLRLITTITGGEATYELVVWQAWLTPSSSTVVLVTPPQVEQLRAASEPERWALVRAIVNPSPGAAADHMHEARVLAQECSDLAAEVGNACSEEQTELRGLAEHFIARGAQSLYSSAVLVEGGLVGDALSCGRTLVEMAIDFAYIALDPTPRIARFTAYGDVNRFRMAEAVNAYGGNLRAEVLAELAERDQHFQDNNQKKPMSWAGVSLRRRATLADRLALYRLAYAEMCDASHSGPGTLEYARVGDGTRVAHFGPMTPDTHPIMVAFSAMLLLIASVVDACGLAAAFGERAGALGERIYTLRRYNPA